MVEEVALMMLTNEQIDAIERKGHWDARLIAHAREANAEIERLRGALEGLCDRADRAREILQDQARRDGITNIDAHANWGMLDTKKEHEALAPPTEQTEAEKWDTRCGTDPFGEQTSAEDEPLYMITGLGMWSTDPPPNDDEVVMLKSQEDEPSQMGRSPDGTGAFDEDADSCPDCGDQPGGCDTCKREAEARGMLQARDCFSVTSPAWSIINDLIVAHRAGHTEGGE